MHISRRGFILAVGGSTVAFTAVGCSSQAEGPVAAPEGPDDRARRTAAESEAQLIAAYRSAASASPAAADRLNYLADQHQQHVAALYPDGAAPSPTGSPGRVDSRRLAKMERAAARQRTEAASIAEDGALVVLLARIAASESGHAAYLQGAGI